MEAFVSKSTSDSSPKQIREAVAHLVLSINLILSSLSLLQSEEFNEEFWRFYKEEDLAAKTLPDFQYQNLYQNIYTEESFVTGQRENFQEMKITFEYSESTALKWENSVSPKYNHDKALEIIKGRYENCYAPIHLTIRNIKTDVRYDTFIRNLRAQGWLDWQIVLAIYNCILNYKTNGFIRREDFQTDDAFKQKFALVLNELRTMDEGQKYIPIGLDVFLGDDFGFHLKNNLILTLQTWNMENKSEFPNFRAIRQFLNIRFNFDKDDINNLSPL